MPDTQNQCPRLDDCPAPFVLLDPGQGMLFTVQKDGMTWIAVFPDLDQATQFSTDCPVDDRFQPFGTTAAGLKELIAASEDISGGCMICNGMMRFFVATTPEQWSMATN